MWEDIPFLELYINYRDTKFVSVLSFLTNSQITKRKVLRQWGDGQSSAHSQVLPTIGYVHLEKASILVTFSLLRMVKAIHTLPSTSIIL